MKSFDKHKNKISLLLLVVCIFGFIGLSEVLLTLLSPVAMTVSGYKMTANGGKYGWGFNPNQLVRVVDPDSGAIYQDKVNSSGWRDIEHNFAKPKDVFRILLLGDSNTFGYIIPQKELYTRVLERKLKKMGYSAEIISMAYSGWGTDQQFEALKEEGLQYKPDLVILQVTSNDLDDNFYWRDMGKFGNRKPFYYKLSDTGHAERHTNKRFLSYRKKFSRNYFVSQSQILMRIDLVKERFRANSCKSLAFGLAQVQQFKLETGELPPESFIENVRAIKGCELKNGNLSKLIDEAGLTNKRDLILNLASWPHFTEIISSARYQMKDLDFESEKWELFFSLIKQAAFLVEKSGGKLALISDQEEGHYNWLRHWHRISGDPMTRRRYNLQTEKLRKFAVANEIGFVENTLEVARALRDPHPNKAGNIAMAENILAYVLSNFNIHRSK